MIKVLKILRMLAHLFKGVFTILYHTVLKKRAINSPTVESAVKLWFSRSCEILGITVRTHGEPTTEPTLFIANHVSWLDIPLVASVVNPRFLSKSEVRKWPLIGWLAEKVNTLFIVRGKGSAAEAASAAIVEGLKAKDQMLIFPEGTTSDGKVIGRFYPRLLGAAIATNSPVQPIVIHYTDSNSETTQSELVPYTGTQTLIGNLWRMLGCKNLTAHVHFLTPVSSTGLARKELASILQTQMQLALQKSQAQQPQPQTVSLSK